MDGSYRNTDFMSIGNPIPMPDKLAGMESVGDRVKQVRKERKLDQGPLAKKAKMAQNSLSDLETGKTKETPQIVKLAVALGVSAYWLDSGKGPKKLGELEQSILELDERDQQAVIDLIGVLRARRAA